MLEREKRYAKPPLRAQHQQSPGLESKVHPRPLYEAPIYRAAGKLEGKVALITGGDSGIGRSVAMLYAREGADVAIVYLKAEQRDALETQRCVQALQRRCLLLAGNVADSQFCREAVRRTVEEYGALDILVNNAAYQKSVERLEDLDDEQLDRTFRTNILGYFYMSRAALPHLQDGAA